MKFYIILAGVLISSLSACSYFNNNQFSKHKINSNPNAISVASPSSETQAFFTSSFTEEPEIKSSVFYAISGTRGKSILKSRIHKAKSIKDLIDYYPSNWIKDYHSVDIIIESKDDTMKATSPDDQLTNQQLELLNSAEYSTDFDIHVHYYSENAVTKEVKVRDMKTTLTLLPEVEASYEAGYEQLIQYFQTRTSAQIEENNMIFEAPISLVFTITEEGTVEDVRLKESSKSDALDALLLTTAKNMSAWSPALDANQNPVRQDFELLINNGGC